MHTGTAKEVKVYNGCCMPCLLTFNPPHKRQHPEQHPCASEYRLKRQKLDKSAISYWDNLSKIWLTNDALKELDRRNSCPRPYQTHRPITRQFHAGLKKPCDSFQLPSLLHDCPPCRLKKIKRLARLGGPDLSDLRDVCDHESKHTC